MARPTPFEIREESDGGATRASLSGELDVRTAVTLSQRVDEMLANGAHALTLDLSDLAFMDSTGLRLLIELNSRAEREQWPLQLIAPKHEGAALVLRVTGADTALPFVDGAD
jgi:anti-sigma B factor antagonist